MTLTADSLVEPFASGANNSFNCPISVPAAQSSTESTKAVKKQMTRTAIKIGKNVSLANEHVCLL